MVFGSRKSIVLTTEGHDLMSYRQPGKFSDPIRLKTSTSNQMLGSPCTISAGHDYVFVIFLNCCHLNAQVNNSPMATDDLSHAFTDLCVVDNPGGGNEQSPQA